MNINLIPLHQLPVGSFGKVKKLVSEGVARRRMLDLGLIYNTTVESIRKSPAGDPVAYGIRGAVIALRSEEASQILVESIES
ncbi:ferrous iron transport protein A [Irregularibacter muris]|uniref:Ferrous iron transport protein A n=1 Tax=Irregularibacter muris TaxID=1796619 RepID=A0AAE3HEB4_9FIRM|nr:FeoA family protein [Irregularibacter muris]MCR1898956.1 ferrous iron transport protein A [Irregularibacter muris]